MVCSVDYFLYYWTIHMCIACCTSLNKYQISNKHPHGQSAANIPEIPAVYSNASSDWRRWSQEKFSFPVVAQSMGPGAGEHDTELRYGILVFPPSGGREACSKIVVITGKWRPWYSRSPQYIEREWITQRGGSEQYFMSTSGILLIAISLSCS